MAKAQPSPSRFVCRAIVRALAPAFALATWLAPAPAAADVLPPVSPECPEGSVPRKDHLGSWCEPTTCDPDQGCAEGQKCRRVALCIETERYHPFHEGAREQLRKVARGPCESDGSCVRPAVCEAAPRCAPRNDGPAGFRTRIGCAAGPAAPGRGHGMAPLALLGLFILRRRSLARRNAEPRG